MKLTASLLSLALAFSVAACSRADDPQTLLVSAQQYIEKGDYEASIIQLKNVLRAEPDNRDARYLLGLASLQTGDIVSAEVELAKAAALGLDSDELHLALARTLLARGEAAKLVASFGDKSLSSAKAQAELRALVGTAQLQRGDRGEASAEFREAVALDATNVLANLGIARLIAADGDVASALRRVEAALATSPSSFEALLLKADLLAADRKPGAATEAYRAAIKAAPHRVAARMRLVKHLIGQRELEAAAAEAQALQKAAPRDVRGKYAKALVLIEQRRFAEAREPILQVLKGLPEHVPSLTLAGMAALETGAYAEAEAHLRKALFNAPEADGARRLLAATHLRMGKTDLAISAVNEMLADKGDDPALLALAGEAHLARGDVPGAVRHYERARKLAPDNVRVQARLGQIRLAAGDEEQGLAELAAASSSDAQEYQADLALIAAHLRQRQADKALAAVQTLEKKQPSNPLTHNLRGMALLLKQDYAAARASFERALQLNPTYMPSVANLTRLDLREKNIEPAKRRYEAVLGKEPKNEQALLGLAVLLRMSGAKSEEIEAVLKRSIAARPSSPASRIALINHHLRTRDFKAALVAAQDAAAALPDNAMIVQAVGVAQIAANEHQQAIATFKRLTELLPKSPQANVLLASAHMAAKRPDDAIRSLRAALALDPGLSKAHRDIAAIYVATGRADQALREARSLQTDQPKEVIGYVLEAEIYVAQKKWDAAERAYRNAVKRFDNPVLVARAHAVIHESGKSAEADALAERWVATHARDAFVLNYLADRDLRARRFERAAERYRGVLERSPNHAMALNNLAWIGHHLKHPRALEYAERAHELAPENPAIMDTLGAILVSSGELEQGLELLGRAAELSPQAYEIRLNFAKALLKADRKGAARKELEALASLDSRHPVQQEAAKLLSGL